MALTEVHEIKQPLMGLQFQVKDLLRQQEALNQGNPELRMRLGDLNDSVDCLTERIKAMQQLLAGHPRQRQSVLLTSLLVECMAAVREQARRQAVKLERRGFERRCCLEADPAQLKIAVINLLHNAIEAAAGSSGCQERRVRLSLAENQHQLIIQVEDTGPGLKALELPELLLNSSKPNGMGLGLHCTELIAEAYGGSVELKRSAALGGAQVSLVLESSDQTNKQRCSATARPGGPTQVR